MVNRQDMVKRYASEVNSETVKRFQMMATQEIAAEHRAAVRRALLREASIRVGLC